MRPSAIPPCLLACLLLAGAVSLRAEVKQLPAKSRITRVTLYRHQALVMREVEVPADQGELGLMVENLPPAIVPDSLFASSPNLKVRSVRYLTELVPNQELDTELAGLERQLQTLAVAAADLAVRQAQLQARQNYLQNLEKQYLAKLGPDVTALGGDQLKVAGFDFDSIGKMTEFLARQSEELTAKLLAFADEERQLAESREELQNKINVLRHGDLDRGQVACQQAIPAPTQNYRRKAVIYVAKPAAGTAALAFSYLVNQAGWNPAYNMRVGSDGNALNLEYLAHVRQLSGEDWHGVALTLSTATPNMNASVPILAPIWVRLIPAPDQQSAPEPSDANPLAQTIQTQLGNVSKFQMRSGGKGDHEDNLALNISGWQHQALEFRNRKEALKRWHEEARQLVQQMAVEYRIPDTVTLASRNDNQMVQILSRPLECTLHYEAVPLLSGYVSRGIEAKNAVDQPLLAGPYSAFIDGQYVGAGEVPVTATGQILILGFGIDPQLRCRRELLDKLADKSWGSRTETYKYRLVLENFKDQPVTVRLLDRIPVTQDKGLKITLKDGADQLCADADYRELDHPKGILRWDLELPPAAAGATAVKLDYSLDLKFDSDMEISAEVQQVEAQMRDALFEMESRRK